MVHHVAFFIKLFTASVEPTKEDGIQPLGIFVHYLFSIVNHTLSFAFFIAVIQNLQLVKEVFD
jgi:hypothetical protein